MNVIQFPTLSRSDLSLQDRKLTSMNDLCLTDPSVDARAAELKDRALESMRIFPPEVIGEMLAYAAARLERTGFKMFPVPADRTRR
jgi:hypothetical protein